MQLPLPLAGHVDDGDADLVIPPVMPPPPAAPRAIEFVRARRARRYILRLRSDGSLRVTVPRGGTLRAAREFVARQDPWIERQRQRMLTAGPAREWADGSQIWLRGERVRITVARDNQGLRIGYGERRITMSREQDIRAAIELDLRHMARCELELRLRELAARHGLDVGRVSIRNQRSRWGSCARGGNIALNFRLIQMPPAISDYVLLHELMHLHQQNHSRRFWRLVEQVCPDFRDAERWLKTEGKVLL